MKVKQLIPVIAAIALLPVAGQVAHEKEATASAAHTAEASRAPSAMSQMEALKARVSPEYYKELNNQVAHSELKSPRGHREVRGGETA